MVVKDNKPVALITGASRGIGRGIAIELAKKGFDIVGNGVQFDPKNKTKGLFEVKERVEERGVAFLPVQANVADLESHDRLIQQSLERFKSIDVFVNNAGVAPHKRVDVLEAEPGSFDRLMAVNLRGAFFLTQKVGLQMIRQQKNTREAKTAFRSCIAFITSISAEAASSIRAEYCISKAALSMAAKIYADRLSEFGINVYEVRPGIIRTDMTAPNKDKYDKLIQGGLVPQKRWGLPEDVGKAVAALVGGNFSYSTGAVIEVSGGMNIRRL